MHYAVKKPRKSRDGLDDAKKVERAILNGELNGSVDRMSRARWKVPGYEGKIDRLRDQTK